MKKTLLLLSIAIIAAHSSSGTEGYFKLPHNSNSGDIWSYNLESTFPSITESENYAYGFDGLTKDCYNAIKQKNKSESNPKDDSELIHCFNHPEKDKDRVPIIYISVEKGKTASFKINNFTCKECLYSKVALIQTKKYKEQDSELILENTSYSLENLNNSKNHLTDGQDHLIKIDKKNPEKAGIYQIIAAHPEHTDDSNTEPQQGIKGKQKKQPHYTWSKFAEIHILPYETLPKKMIFVPFNGTGENRWDVVKEKNGFNKDSVIYYFNKVYKQAVLKPVVDELKADDFGLSEDIEINITNPNDEVYREMYKKGLNRAIKEGNLSDFNSPYWHIIYAINKIRKIWDLKNCYTNNDFDENIELIDDRKYDLQNCGTAWEEENENTNYVLASYEKCSTENVGIGDPIKKDVIIKAKQKTKEGSSSFSKYKTSYYIFDKNNPNKKLEYKKCDYLYTDNGYPIIPKIEAVKGNVGASSVQMLPATNNKIVIRHDEYLPYGSIIFVPRRKGESAQYVLMHELGHSYGLTDVAKSATIYRVIDQDKNKNADKIYYNDDKYTREMIPHEEGVIDYRKYVNYYGSKETNLMTWQTPNGPKIRYRKTQIACTGGTVYYKATNYKQGEDGKAIYEFDKKKGSLGSIQRIIKDGFENQWECIRGKCYDEKYSTDYSTFQRKSFWKYTEESTINGKKNFCYDNPWVKDPYKQEEEDRNIQGNEMGFNSKHNEELKKYIIDTYVQTNNTDNEDEPKTYERYKP